MFLIFKLYIDKWTFNFQNTFLVKYFKFNFLLVKAFFSKVLCAFDNCCYELSKYINGFLLHWETRAHVALSSRAEICRHARTSHALPYRKTDIQLLITETEDMKFTCLVLTNLNSVQETTHINK